MLLSLNKQRGFSLLEVLVSASIAAIALISLGVAQIKALQFATSSFQYTVATVEANNAGELLWPELCRITQSGEYAAVIDEITTQAPGYTLILPTSFDNDFNIQVTWEDDRLDSNIAASVSLFPQYPTLDTDSCS